MILSEKDFSNPEKLSFIQKALEQGRDISINIKGKKLYEKEKGHKKWVMFPGRWQPLHEGHLAIIQKALNQGKNVCIAIRDTELSEKNPYTVGQRREMIKRAFREFYGDRVIDIVIPDIEGIWYGRGVGYEVNEVDVPEAIKEISATNVRAGNDDRIHKDVFNYINLLQSTIWLTGLPCAGKTTLAKKLKEELDNLKKDYRVMLLDGDDVRQGLNQGLGFSYEDRKENLRRIAHVSKIFNDKGNTVIASFVSPTNELRNYIRGIISPEKFKLVYVKCSLEECEKRDVKGMYAKARKGEIKQFTGIDASFEEPISADVVVDTEKNDVETCVNQILTQLGFT